MYRLCAPARYLSVIVLCCYSISSYGALQGSTGPTSSGNIDINLIMGLNVRISSLADLAFGTWSGTGDVAANDNLCVGRTGVGLSGSGSYRILASGDGAPGDPSAFTLSNGVNTLRYEAYFNDQAGVSGRQPLIGGLALTNQTGTGLALRFNMFGCIFQNANISVILRESELRGGAGSYSGTLSLMLIPE